MAVYSIYFSPTGRTKKALDYIVSAFSDVREIDLSIFSYDYSQFSFNADDICFIAVPSFGGRVPSVCLENLSKMSAYEAKAVIVTSFGNREFDDTLLGLKNFCLDMGFLVPAAVSTVTEHSLVREYGKGRPNDDDKAELCLFSEKIKEYLKTECKEVDVPGKIPYKVFGGSPLKPKGDSHCTSCGLCAKLCPVGAIDVKNLRETDETKCITCMRCVEICKNNARSINKVALFAVAQKLKKVCKEPKINSLFLGE